MSVWKEAKLERNAYNALAKALIEMGGMFVLHVDDRSRGLFSKFSLGYCQQERRHWQCLLHLISANVLVSFSL